MLDWSKPYWIWCTWVGSIRSNKFLNSHSCLGPANPCQIWFSCFLPPNLLQASITMVCSFDTLSRLQPQAPNSTTRIFVFVLLFYDLLYTLHLKFILSPKNRFFLCSFGRERGIMKIAGTKRSPVRFNQPKIETPAISCRTFVFWLC